MANWDIGTFLANATDTIQGWGGLFLMLIGVVMIIVAGYKIATGLMSDNKQVSWFKVVVLLIVGGVLAFGGYEILSDAASMGKHTIDELGR